MAFNNAQENTEREKSMLPLQSHTPSSELLPVEHCLAMPLIDRQLISPELESEIRYACALLCYSVKWRTPLQYHLDQLGAGEMDDPIETTGSTTSQERAGFSHPRALDECPREEYDIDFAPAMQQPKRRESTGQGTARFYRQYSRHMAKDWTAAATVTQSYVVQLMDDESDFEKTPPPTERHTATASAVQLGPHETDDPLDDYMFRNANTGPTLPKTTTFGWLRQRRWSHSRHADYGPASVHQNGRESPIFNSHSLYDIRQKYYSKVASNRSASATQTATALAAGKEHRYKAEAEVNGSSLVNKDETIHSEATRVKQRVEPQSNAEGDLITEREAALDPTPLSSKRNAGAAKTPVRSLPRKLRADFLQKLSRIGNIKRKIPPASGEDRQDISQTVHV